MHTNFWHERWRKGEIAFHASEANPFLVKYFDRLKLPLGGRVFVPLCGKTLDISWLLSKGCRVAGAELSKLAIDQLFAEMKVKPKISKIGTLEHYSAPNLDIFVGDIFELASETLGPVNAVYDRAALVALPESLRSSYTRHLMSLTHKAPQLLICYEYDQRLQEGPPFSISSAEVYKHYQDRYLLSLLTTAEVAGGLKGKAPAKEHVWLLKKL
jgi:thiopurine S-methyltransferase